MVALAQSGLLAVRHAGLDCGQRGEAAGVVAQVPTSIMRYLSRAFYVAVAAAIAHTIKTTRQLAARYSKGVMAPSPSVPGLAIVPVSRYLRNGSLDVYRLDFCRHSYLSSRRMWRIGEHGAVL